MSGFVAYIVSPPYLSTKIGAQEQGKAYIFRTGLQRTFLRLRCSREFGSLCSKASEDQRIEVRRFFVEDTFPAWKSRVLRGCPMPGPVPRASLVVTNCLLPENHRRRCSVRHHSGPASPSSLQRLLSLWRVSAREGRKGAWRWWQR